jgi:crotonobetainyl-CoA:carnitine CoA-transferase CaiB-like acyl-CoA transferase
LAAPLDDITVIEVDSYMAAPSAGAVLADLGARVIKVEPFSGDPLRGLGRPAKVSGSFEGYDFGFDVDNRGKQSIAVALDTEEGAALVRRLVSNAEVFLCNLLPHRQARFGLDPESLKAANPRIIHATLTGYGTDGPDALRPGYDVTAFFARSGLYDAMRGGDEGEVPQARPAQGDNTAGLALVSGILAALRLAERTGEAQVIETSLFETAVWTQATDFGVVAVDKAPVRRRSRHNQLGAEQNRYPCADGKWVVINQLGRGSFDRFAKVLGKEDWLDDERFADGKSRYRNMPALVDAVDSVMKTRTRDEWGALFDEAGVIWGSVQTLEEVADDQQAEAIGLFPAVTHAQRGSYRSVRIPMRIHGSDVGPQGPAPECGEHTDEILRGAGLSESEVRALIAAGAIQGD